MPEQPPNRSRRPADPGAGHYESWFLRANHPSRPLAFWLRYTLTVPTGAPDQAFGSLWGVFFDAEQGRSTALRQDHPIDACALSAQDYPMRLGPAQLSDQHAHGVARSAEHRLAWALRWTHSLAPVGLLPDWLQRSRLPVARSLTPAPLARFDGNLMVDGRAWPVRGWPGCQSHNWGPRHTRRYAWAQVCGFDDAPDAFLECVAASPVPGLTLGTAVLIIDGERLHFNSPGSLLRAHSRVDGLHWQLRLTGPGGSVLSVDTRAPDSSFAALGYPDTDGGLRTCLNSKLGRCAVRLSRPGQPDRLLISEHRAALELVGQGDADRVTSTA